jgi:hypothetical protein
MFRNPMPGEVIVLPTKRLSRAQAREVVIVLQSLGADRDRITVSRDRRQVSAYGPKPYHLSPFMEKISAVFFRWGINVAMKYEEVSRSLADCHLVFHLSPKPSAERLKEIVDRVGEVPEAERRLWFAPPLATDRIDPLAQSGACLFVHVYFDRECDDDTLAAAKQQVVAIVGVQPFDMALLAP